jgi:Xaa-Pro aminopeptidase
MTVSSLLLLTDPINIRYVTGFIGVAPEEREAYAVIGARKTYLLSSSLYRQEAKRANAEFIELTAAAPLATVLAGIIKAEAASTLYFEAHNLTVAEHTHLMKALPHIAVVAQGDEIASRRQHKTPEELAMIQKAVTLTDACFNELLPRIRQGVTEQELSLFIDQFFRHHGAHNAFPPIVAFGAHASSPHYHETSSKPLPAHGLVLIDFGAKVDGYCADMTRVVFVGTPRDQWVLAYETVRSSQQKAIDLLIAGERHGAILDAEAKKIIEDAGFPPYSHSLGHAIGLAVHESPRLSVRKDDILETGNVFSIEPGIYVEGKFGIRIEDLVALTEEGPIVLSKSPKHLISL